MPLGARFFAALLAGTVLLASGCATTPDVADGPATAPAVGGEPTDGAVGDEPMPVEGDGGIGGEGGGHVTSDLILSAERVAVTQSCLLAEDPPTYRLDLPDGSLTVVVGQSGSLVLELAGATFTSPGDQPPAVSGDERGVSAQGRVVSDAGDGHFVDAVIGLDDLPDC